MSESGALAKILLGKHGGKAEQLSWSAAEAQALQLASSRDAHGYWYNGLVSLGEAIQGVQRERYTWATVKAYYSCFYLSRAILGFGGISVEFLWSGGKARHYVWQASAGGRPTRIAGNTHDSVLHHVDNVGAIPRLTGQDIAGSPAGSWLISQRVQANYGAPFTDPMPTECLAFIARGNMRQVFQAYVEDTQLLYTFDEDHAMLAYPVALAHTLSNAEEPGFSNDELSHLRSLYRDNAGPLAFAGPLFAR